MINTASGPTNFISDPSQMPCLNGYPKISETIFSEAYVFKKGPFDFKSFWGDQQWIVEGPWLNGQPHGPCIFE
jgi:hypothetical protein